MSETINSTAIIDVDTNGVRAIVAEVQKSYGTLQGKIDEFKKRKDGVSNYWTSVEASNYVEQLNKISSYCDDFSKHYDMFIDFIEKALKSYDEIEEGMVASVAASTGANVK